MKLPRGLRAARRAMPRLPLMVTFGAISLAVTVAIGAVLASQIKEQVQERSTQTLTQSTRGAVAMTMNTIVTGLTYNPGETAVNTTKRTDQVAVITRAAKLLVSSSQTVVVEGLLANGMHIGGASAPAVGTMSPLDDDFRAALAGKTLIRTLKASNRSLSPVEAGVVAKYGSVLKFEQGVRLTAGGPILGVVRTYTPFAATDRQAASDTRSLVWLLVLGMALFWGLLFRLVWGASRTMRQQSRANIQMATHDSLTGLPNRRLLRDNTELAIKTAGRSGGQVALLLMDLDRFKEINDTLGHHYGDLLLHQVGVRLRQHLREGDTVARLGGDEFVVLLPDIASAAEAFNVAEKLNVSLQQPFLLDGITVDVASSTGIVISPEDGDDFDQLLRHADIAMYAAKQDSLEIVAFTTEMDSYTRDRLVLLADLRQAMDDPAQIVLHYQPQSDLRTGRIIGVEALARWQHPEKGLLPPDAFIPMAEKTGILRPMTWIILRSALEQNRRWADDGLLLPVAVNISARCLLDSGFCERLVALLDETGVPAERLKLELTESAIMTDPGRARRILEAVASHGIGLSIDDFGTGHSSLAYLKNLPVTEFKIDRVFVGHMDTDESDAAIVRSCLELARNLHLTVVAEGVETLAVQELLRELGCETAQGYFLSRPLPASQLESWLRAYRSPNLPALARSGSVTGR